MNSEQELLVKLLMDRCAGAPFIFQPDTYRKGKSALREPADLAWACNGCIALFYMQATVAPCSDAIEHNVRQATGWMRAWRSAQLLVGRNKYQEFSIAHDTFPKIAIISVVECADGVMAHHDDHCRSLNVARCATIPQTALHMLANIRASMMDVLGLVEALRMTRKELSLVEAISQIADYEQCAVQKALPALGVPIRDCAHLIEIVASNLHDARGPNPDGPLPAAAAVSGAAGPDPALAPYNHAIVNSVAASPSRTFLVTGGALHPSPTDGYSFELAEAVADLPLSDFMHIVFLCASAMHSIVLSARKKQARQIVQHATVGRRHVVVRVATTTPKLHELIMQGIPIDRPIAPESLGNVDILIGGVQVSEGSEGLAFHTLFAFKGCHDKSNTELLLDGTLSALARNSR